MSNTPTPRTDAAENHSGFVLANFARQLERDLARVTAERDGEFRRSDIELADAVQKESYLRARVAELEQEVEDWKDDRTLAGYRVGELATKLEQAKQRNAELAAALRPFADAARLLDHAQGTFGIWTRSSTIPGHSYTITVQHLRDASAALARVTAEHKDALESAKYWYKSAATLRARVADPTQ